MVLFLTLSQLVNEKCILMISTELGRGNGQVRFEHYGEVLLCFETAKLGDFGKREVGGKQILFCHSYALLFEVCARGLVACCGEERMEIIWTQVDLLC